ncbi:MAG: ribosome recycling factor [Gammaproteobacteria bacterium RIFCSPLOWO2_02_FULL_42_14]|nr:MAG: ribosome recycling factor [Gammaproteobacteria bacterium RIFCSPHIGHO2_02_FULL_42_43]OGT27429.1 MAG: ribosome recycling factor [Gammaproteobacteria bacterium RIFCSPHIGHO2_01_FULL_42_8]OGT52362.1 MAG: ribosome recycling factor [Gammaproteobacteria bacterium RIFCSPHIGHO2_12_FULL_41_25]OGT63348.1 MAG: ribosome recycling factor [Gammaproteobacteria bacterium RIFCSPLOWO2_02_FULL_42_14]OGT86315.1 MAG: ribosome recycling factor [Gammaproteobacteria bacterium RIFCSPLOWO2_12_FULL_42_18]
MSDKIMRDAKARMEKSLDAFKQELAKLRTGRAHPSVVEHVMVNYYGNASPLNQVANIAVENARTLSITPWEKSMVPEIEKAILMANLGLTPSTAGTVIRIPMPPMTEERRKSLGKIVREEAEKTRVSIRTVRRDANQELKTMLKDKLISEDEDRRMQTSIQKVTDEFVAQVDTVATTKEKDLMEM